MYIFNIGTQGDRADMIDHEMSEQDVRRIMAAPFAIIASDSGVDKPGGGRPHPPGYG
jgi:dihydroorotase/N-acyl-D-amino-acid deacylase